MRWWLRWREVSARRFDLVMSAVAPVGAVIILLLGIVADLVVLEWATLQFVLSAVAFVVWVYVLSLDVRYLSRVRAQRSLDSSRG